MLIKEGAVLERRPPAQEGGPWDVVRYLRAIASRGRQERLPAAGCRHLGVQGPAVPGLLLCSPGTGPLLLGTEDQNLVLDRAKSVPIAQHLLLFHTPSVLSVSTSTLLPFF